MMRYRALLGTHAQKIKDANGNFLLSLPATWSGPIVERLEIPTHAECGPQWSGHPVIMASKVAAGRRWYRCNGRTRTMDCSPGVDVLGCTYERDHGRWECSPGGETVCLRLPQSVLDRYLQDDAYHFDVGTQYAIRDIELTNILFRLADELQRGQPNGGLFAEGLCLSAVGWIARHYASKRQPEERLRKLSVEKRAKIEAFIESSLDSPISVEQMATEIGISPSHFTTLFRLSFGTSPHRYLIKKRVERAAQMLRHGERRSITEIAFSIGFSSQAHFSSAFKTHMGSSPTEWKKLQR